MSDRPDPPSTDPPSAEPTPVEPDPTETEPTLPKLEPAASPASEAPKSRTLRQKMARFALITGGAGLGVVGLVLVSAGGGLFWLTTDSGNAFIRDQVVEQAAPFIPEGKLALKSVDTNLYGHLILQGVELQAPDGHPMLAIDEVRLRYSLRHIFDTRLDIEEVALVAPVVDVQVLADGNLDIAAAFGPSAPSEPAPVVEPAPWIDIPADIRLKALKLERVKVRYRDASDPEAPMDVQVDGLELSGAVDLKGRQAAIRDLHLGLAKLEGLDLDLPLPLAFDGAFTYDESKLNIDQLELQARRTHIGIGGYVDRVDFDDRVLALRIDDISLDEGDIEALAQDDVLFGGLALGGTVDGPLSDLSVHLDVTTTGGPLAVDAWVDTTAEPLAWKAGLATPGLDVDKVTPLVPQTTHLNIEVAAEGAGTDPNTDMRAQFSVKARDQVVFDEVLSELTVGGRLDGGVVHLEELGAVHSAARVAAKGSIDLVNEVVALEELNAQVPSLAALGKYGAGGLRGSFGYSGRLRVEGFGEGGVLLAEGGLDLRGFSAQDAVALRTLSGPVQARVELDTQAVKASGRTRIKGLTAPSTEIGGIDLGWEATVRGGVVTAATSLALEELSVGGGAVQIARISTLSGKKFRGGVDRSGEPWAVGRLAMSAMGFGTAGYEAEGGEIWVGFRDPDGEQGPDDARVEVGFDLDRNGEQSFFEGEVHGDLVSGDWHIDGLVIAPSEDNPLVADGPVKFKLVDGGARDIHAVLRSDAGSIVARGNWVPDSEDGSTLDLEVDKVDLAHVAKMAQLFVAPEKEGQAKLLEGLAGIASLKVKLDDQPGRDLVVDAIANLDGIVYPDTVEQMFLDAEVHGPITLPVLTANLEDADEKLMFALDGKVPLVIVEGAPQLDCSRLAAIDAIVAPGNIQRFSTTLPIAGELPDVTASVAVRVDGSACDPNLSLVASASVPSGRNGERVRVDLDVHRNEGQVDIEGGVDLGLKRRMAIDGHATTNLSKVFEGAFAGGEMPPTDQMSTFASAFDLSITPLGIPIQDLGMFVELPRGITGRIAGGLNVSGTPKAPFVTGALLWTEGALGKVGLDQAAFMMLPADGGYLLDGDLAFSTGGALMMDGFVPLELDLDAGGDVDLNREGFEVEFKGEGVPLQALEGLVSGLSNAGGALRVTGRVDGTIANPVPTLDIGISQGAFTFAETRLSYREMRLNAVLTKDKLDLKNFKMVADPWSSGGLVAATGPLRVEGAVLFEDGFQPASTSLNITADNFWVIDTKDMALKIDSAMEVRGHYPDLHVGGDLAILEGQLTLDESVFLPVSDLALDGLLVVHRQDEQYIQGEPQLAAPEDDIANRVTVDLDIDMSRGFGLDVAVPMDSSMGSVGASLSTARVDLEVTSPELQVGMKKGQLSLVGDVQMDRGDLDFFGKTFDIGNGKLTFVGENFADPQLEIQAVNHTGKYGDVAVAVNGTVSSFEVQFQSDEYPDQTDILSILLFGKPASELGDSEGQAGGSQLSAALQMAAGSQINSALGATFNGQVEFDGGALKVGIPLSNKHFLTIERNAAAEDDENLMSVSLEWLISRQMYAEMVTGDKGQSSADLYMRWRF